MKVLLAVILIFSPMLVFAESELTHADLRDSGVYFLEIDEHGFEIPYVVDADVIAMAADPELNSFLIGLKDASDSVMVIYLEHQIIQAEENNFAVLVNGIEVDYEIESDADRSMLTFFVPEFSEEVEIIGAQVIPEFPLGVLVMVAVSLTAVLAVSRSRQSLFKL